MTRTVLFTGDIFRQQPRGGITRYVLEITRRLSRPAEVLVGLHQSVELGGLTVPARAALRLPAFRGVHRVAAPVNALVDAAGWSRRRDLIVHPSYYRDPRGLPRGTPVVVTVHDMTHERLPEVFAARGGGWEPARHKLALCQRADLVLCNSATTLRDLLELGGVPAARVRLTPHASRDWLGIEPAAIPGLREPFLLWVGERHAYKNFLPALAAWASCTEAADTTLLCVGGGPFRPHERAALAACGAAGRVSQRDCTDGELAWAYAHAAALVHASLWEGFGVTLLEALAHGCPVLASDRAPFHEVAGEQAVFAEPTDVDALRGGLRAVLAQGRDPATVAARRAQAARFSWDTCAAQHEAAYRELD